MEGGGDRGGRERETDIPRDGKGVFIYDTCFISICHIQRGHS